MSFSSPFPPGRCEFKKKTIELNVLVLYLVSYCYGFNKKVLVFFFPFNIQTGLIWIYPCYCILLVISHQKHILSHKSLDIKLLFVHTQLYEKCIIVLAFDYEYNYFVYQMSNIWEDPCQLSLLHRYI